MNLTVLRNGRCIWYVAGYLFKIMPNYLALGSLMVQKPVVMVQLY